MPRRLSRRGFTLVEIMIVVTIIALLAAIAIPNLLRARRTAQEAAAQGTLKLISNALENYAAINNIYPPSTTPLTSANPPYLSQNYFMGSFDGYSYSATLGDYYYTITASPIDTTPGVKTYTISTGGILTGM